MSPRQARIGVDVFTFAMAASIGVALAGLTWRLLGDPGTRFGASPVAARPARAVDIAPLIALAPFGAAPAPVAAQGPSGPLVLRGILLAEPRSASSALIAVGDAAPVAFYAGQPVGSATIESIALDHVVLLSGGARFSLGFPNATPPSAATTPPPSAMTASPPAGPLDPAALLGALGAQPAGTGLAVATPSPAMRGAGLLPGDQIVAINGSAVADVLRTPGLLQAAAAAGTARIDILRAGQKLALSVPLR